MSSDLSQKNALVNKRIVWQVEVPKHLNDLLDLHINKGVYKTKSEFIRVAVRDRLRLKEIV